MTEHKYGITREKLVNDLIGSEVIRLKDELEHNINAMRSEEQGLPSKESHVSESKAKIQGCKDNIKWINERIELLE